jgi:hypothetical protein
MLSRNARITDLNLEQWRRLTQLAYTHAGARRLYLLHQAGTPLKFWDSELGELPLPGDPVLDPQASADALAAKHSDAHEVWVLEADSFAKKMSEIQAKADFDQELDDYALFEFEERLKAPGLAVSPKRDFFWNGFPLRRVQRFVDKMLPESCVFVLGVFDGDQLWASLLVEFENKKIISISTSDFLPVEDIKDVVGRDQHPYFLSVAANAFRRPAFGWFVERSVFERYMMATDMEAKDEIFQKALMENKATFDFNILVDRGITAFSPINPGQAAIQGQDREANPRTQTPDPDDSGPSAF